MSQPITITDWQKGVANSPHVGFGLMRMVDIEAFEGAVKVQKAPTSIFPTTLNESFIAETGPDTLVFNNAPATGTAVRITTATPPAGLTQNVVYFAINVSTIRIKMATTLANALAGTAIDITGGGAGTIETVNPGQINHFAKNYNSNVTFMIDSFGRVWYLSNGGSVVRLLVNAALDTAAGALANASGKGIAVFQNSDASATYLFAFRNATIDVIPVTNDAALQTPVWSNAWQSLNTGSGSSGSHHALIGQDNMIYFCDKNFVGSIRENAGSVFDPATGGTYTYNNQAVDMPQLEVLNWLEELGVTLLAAGDTYDKIYPWDRVSDSYNLPLLVGEKSISKMKNIGNTVFILAGAKGNIYTTQGTYVKKLRKIPDAMVNNASVITVNPVTWGGIAARNGALLFGLAGQTTGNKGVYLMYPDGRFVMDQIPSTGSANVTALFAESDLYLMGYSGGADYQNGATRYAAGQAVIQSALYTVENKTQKATFSTVEIQLAQASTGTCVVSWRGDTNSSWTAITTFTLDGSATSFEEDASLTNIENIQIQLELSGNIEVLLVQLTP